MGLIYLLSFNYAVEKKTSAELKKSRQSRDSNPGPLGEKCKHYLSAMLPPKVSFTSPDFSTWKAIPMFLPKSKALPGTWSSPLG